jgi:tetratricopeptide (TPR) repeat protein
LRFHHILIRDAAYGTLPKAERAQLHERFARWLELDSGESDELVGFHLEQAHAYLAEVSRGELAERLGMEAGDRLGAAGLGAWRRANTAATVGLLRRAARLLPRSAPNRLELLCELGLALRTAGEIEEANHVLREAVDLAAGEGERRIELRARIELANSYLSAHPQGGADVLLGLVSTAVPVFEALGDDRALGRAWLLSGYVEGGLHCRNAKWLDAAERALGHYRRSGWPSATCSGEIATALYYGPVPVEEAAGRCRTLLNEISERTGAAHVRLWLGGLEAFAGRIDDGRRLVEQARLVYEEFGYRMALLCGCCAVLAEIELLAGNRAAAEQALRTSCEGLEALHEQACLASRAAELAEVVYGRGAYDEAERWYRVAERHTATDDVGARFLTRAVGAKLLARRGALAEARRMADEALSLSEQTDALNNRAKVLLDRAEVLRLSRRRREAAADVERALGEFERKGNIVAADRMRALLAAKPS